MCERTVTIPLEEYEDLVARANAEDQGHFERTGEKWNGNKFSPVYSFYKEIPDPSKTEWGKQMIKVNSELRNLNIDYEKNYYSKINSLNRNLEDMIGIEKKLSDKLNKIPKFIRKIYGAQ